MLHVHYKKELKSKDDHHHKVNQSYIRSMSDNDLYQQQLVRFSNETAQYKQQLERAQSLIEAQNLSFKLLQEELGEEAEFDHEESPQMRSVRRECEKRVNQHAERLCQLQSDMDAAIAKRDALLEKAKQELKDAQDEADDAQHGAITMFNEQKHHESHIDRMQDDVHRAKLLWTRCETKLYVCAARSTTCEMKGPT
jgi:methyl-accepting chemotaxis protein